MTISSAAFAQYVEERFGSDAAFKIEFSGLDGRRMSLEEGDTLYKALGEDCRLHKLRDPRSPGVARPRGHRRFCQRGQPDLARRTGRVSS
jgi:hypothetical protein